MTELESRVFEIPKGYIELEPGNILQEGDYYWSPTNLQWMKTKQAGTPIPPAKDGLRYARKKEHEPQLHPDRGTW